MSQVNLKPEMVLNAINTHLNQQFFVEPRSYSKNLFNSLSIGNRHPFMNFEMGDSGDVLCDLELDVSEHVGKLNYGKFRKGLAMMMLSVQQRLESKESVNPLGSNTGEVVFNIPGVLKTEEDLNIIVCSFRELAPGRSSVRLMYLNPDDYAESAGIKLSDIKRNDQDIVLNDE